ncbi:unnamed protein product [Ceutorhynchus assimilis]|uniref:Uncharacterized protein n=1 Tax=Ceutorhynchus assimilis TaxID=467358 RepID=A0A9N9MDS5_9CUCU|nr:unnamed protein product [Ceutorhynchus assimilis]
MEQCQSRILKTPFLQENKISTSHRPPMDHKSNNTKNLQKNYVFIV